MQDTVQADDAGLIRLLYCCLDDVIAKSNTVRTNTALYTHKTLQQGLLCSRAVCMETRFSISDTYLHCSAHSHWSCGNAVVAGPVCVRRGCRCAAVEQQLSQMGRQSAVGLQGLHDTGSVLLKLLQGKLGSLGGSFQAAKLLQRHQLCNFCSNSSSAADEDQLCSLPSFCNSVSFAACVSQHCSGEDASECISSMCTGS